MSNELWAEGHTEVMPYACGRCSTQTHTTPEGLMRELKLHTQISPHGTVRIDAHMASCNQHTEKERRMRNEPRGDWDYYLESHPDMTTEPWQLNRRKRTHTPREVIDLRSEGVATVKICPCVPSPEDTPDPFNVQANQLDGETMELNLPDRQTWETFTKLASHDALEMATITIDGAKYVVDGEPLVRWR